MKKALALMMVVGMLFSCIPAMAAPIGYETEKWYATNTGSGNQNVIIPITPSGGGRAYIAPGKHRIVSMEVTSTRSAALSIPVAALYDSTTIGGATNKALEGEIEETTSGTSAKLEYDRPLKIKNGVLLTQGAYTTVKLEYERIQP